MGRFRVRRESGFLPPGVTKQLESGAGVTRWFGVPVGRFRVDGAVLDYLRWPVQDAIALGGDGLWHGEGRLFGWRFCRFRLEPVPEPARGVPLLRRGLRV